MSTHKNHANYQGKKHQAVNAKEKREKTKSENKNQKFVHSCVHKKIINREIGKNEQNYLKSS